MQPTKNKTEQKKKKCSQPRQATLPGPSARLNTDLLLCNGKDDCFWFFSPHIILTPTPAAVNTNTVGRLLVSPVTLYEPTRNKAGSYCRPFGCNPVSLFLLLSWPLAFPQLFSSRKLSLSEYEGTWPSVGTHTRTHTYSHKPQHHSKVWCSNTGSIKYSKHV